MATQRPDASGVAYNPATLAFLQQTSILAGSSVVMPTATVTYNGEPTGIRHQTFFVPYAHFAHPFSEGMAYGLGVYSRYGLGTRYPADWPGNTSIIESSLQTISATPVLAFKVTDDFSLGIGAEIMQGEVIIRQKAVTGQSLDQDSSGVAFGGIAGAFCRLNGQWAAGFVARAPMDVATSGRVDVSGGGPLQSGSVRMKTRLPDSYTLAVSYSPWPDLSIEVGAVFTRWEQLKKFSFDFGDDTFIPDTDSWKYSRNTWKGQLGVEYRITDGLDLRFGYAVDEQPWRRGYEDFMLPIDVYQNVGAGFGFRQGSLAFDMAYSYLWSKDRKDMVIDGANAEFCNPRSHQVDLSVSYSF